MFNHAKVITQALELLYHSADLQEGLDTILKMTGDILRGSRVYVFEKRHGGDFYDNTYEWCANGISPQRKNLQGVPSDVLKPWEDAFGKADLIHSADINTMPAPIQEVLSPQGIKSILVCRISQENKYIGFMGIDNCETNSLWSDEELQLLRDITSLVSTAISRIRKSKELKEALNVLEIVLDSVEGLVYVSDPVTYDVLYVNKFTALAIGTSRKSLYGKKCWSVLQRNQTGPCPFCPIPKLKEFDFLGESIRYEFKNTVNGRWYRVTDKLMEWMSGSVVHFQNAIDITDVKEAEERLIVAATTDPMTGLLNREAGLGMLRRMIDTGRITKKPVVVGFLDIDNLKTVNDTYGHEDGDFLIKSITKTVRDYIRNNDVLCRIGGDEFLLLLPGCTLKKAGEIMQHVDEELLRMSNDGSRLYGFSLSYGLKEILPDEQTSSDEVVRAADALMYAQKTKKKHLIKRSD